MATSNIYILQIGLCLCLCLLDNIFAFSSVDRIDNTSFYKELYSVTFDQVFLYPLKFCIVMIGAMLL